MQAKQRKSSGLTNAQKLGRLGRVALTILVCYNGIGTHSIAQEGLRDQLGIAQQRCGFQQHAAAQIEQSAKLTSLEFERKLELVVHFPAGSTEIPLDCTNRLSEIAQAVKNGKTGGLLIRSSTSTDSSTELDLAIASSRLDVIAQFFRDNRLARKTMTLELHPETSSLMIGASIETPRVVEIYSSPAN